MFQLLHSGRCTVILKVNAVAVRNGPINQIKRPRLKIPDDITLQPIKQRVISFPREGEENSVPQIRAKRAYDFTGAIQPSKNSIFVKQSVIVPVTSTQKSMVW